MSKEKLSKSEICGYCGSKIMWDVDDDNFEPSEEDKLHEDEYDYIVYCSNPNCKYHKHTYIGDMDEISFSLYQLDYEEEALNEYNEKIEQIKLWINEYGKDFRTLMSEGKITNINCPVSYNLRKDTRCDYKCKECWDNIVDKLNED